MKILCGLGNPGRDYARHRHNVGFQVVDRLWSRAGASAPKSKFEAKVGEGALGAVRVLLLEPQTFMNLSGKSLAPAARFYKVSLDDILVIHDELDLPFGRLQLKRGGGTGGHNGLGSIRECLGSAEFTRLRVGIGKPSGPGAKERVIGHVLSAFDSEEAPRLDALYSDAAEAAEAWATEGLEAAMNRFNRRAATTPP